MLILLLIPSKLIGWGPEGHEIVAAVAQSRLTDDARRGINSLVGEASLTSLANWADELRRKVPNPAFLLTTKIAKSACGVPGLCGLDGNVILAVPRHGFVGIGTTSPSNTLEVVAGGTTLADAWTVRSSRTFKTNIRPLQGALEKVEQLQGVSYQRKSDSQQEIGVVAEDVDQVVPEVVSRDPETNEVQGVDYARLTALLIEAVKSQQAEIQQLTAQVAQLQANASRQ